MKPSIEFTEKISRFIQFGSFMTRDLREEMAGIVFEHFHTPGFDGKAALARSEIAKSHSFWGGMIAKLLEQETSRDIFVNNEPLSLRITEEVLEWFDKTHDEVLERDEAAGELGRLREFEKDRDEYGDQDWLELVASLKLVYPELKQAWDFYEKKLREIHERTGRDTAGKGRPGEQDKLSREQEAVRSKIGEDWQAASDERLQSLLEEEFLQGLPGVLTQGEDFFKRMDRFYRRVAGYFGGWGRFWDLSEGQWQDVGWRELERYARNLEKQKWLEDLAEELGRFQRAEEDYDEALLEETEIRDGWRIKAAGRSEIAGVRFSDDLSMLLPCEVALLSTPETEIIFSKKFVEKKLLTFDHQSMSKVETKEKKQNRPLESGKEKKGPIIVCVDTSASMHGVPERIAKTIVFALVKICLRQARKCYLISFSTRINTLEVTDLGRSVAKLAAFLEMSFYGGTDPALALAEAMEMLQGSDYQEADVLMVSDFITPSLDDDILAQIRKTRQRRMTRFHSLVISEQHNPHFLEVFDNSWFYNSADPEATTSLVRKIKTIQAGATSQETPGSYP